MSKKNTRLKWGIGLLVVVAVALITGGAINVNIENGKVKADIVYSEENVTPEITGGIDGVEAGQGEITLDGESIPTIESIDATGPQVNPEDETPVECPEGEECGRGASFPYVDTSSAEAFINATMGKCYNIDGYYGEQCWDYAALFFLNYAGHTFYTCGTGAAKGAIVDGCWQKNAGDNFTMIWDANKLQPGDIVVFDNGTFGHVGVATGYYNNGYITLAGQNQGGGLCQGSSMGARVNVINISLKNFAGAFRPNSYIKPEPAPEPEPSPDPAPESDEYIYVVVKGDTLGQILRDYGYTGDKLFGDDGLAQKVATENNIKNRGLIFPQETIKIKKAYLK